MSTTVTTQIPTGTWSIDPIHSSIGFGVKHLGVSTFRGNFKQAAGSIVDRGRRDHVDRGHGRGREPRHRGARSSRATCTARTSSTPSKHPELTFKSTSIEPAEDGKLRVTGDLTIRGVTHPVELDAEIEGVGDGPDGATRIGISATRRDRPLRLGHHLEPPLANGALRRRRARQADPARRSRMQA